mgnify:CR=1 FL=1
MEPVAKDMQFPISYRHLITGELRDGILIIYKAVVDTTLEEKEEAVEVGINMG